MRINDDAMAVGEHRYREVLDPPRAAGFPAAFTQAAAVVPVGLGLEDGVTVLATDAEDWLPSNPQDHRGWGAGLYPSGSEYDDGPEAFLEDENGSPTCLYASCIGWRVGGAPVERLATAPH